MIPALSQAAARLGLRLVCNEMDCGGSATHHWMVNTMDGVRVLDYWPVRGTWWCRHDGARGNVRDPIELLELAHGLWAAQSYRS
jgi:hypothetical protein